MKFCTACNNNFPDTETFCPSDGEVLQESPENIVGAVIDGKYKIESFIAQGGMGAVYRARHILLGDLVVIKTLRSEMRGNSEWLKRFQREGKAARAFRHPNSVTVYDLSAGSDGMIYMVMEYVEGHTLDKELKNRGRLTPAEALEVLEPVADVLDSAHVRGVVHRDLKPENIMLGKDDHGNTIIKLLDLGIAKLVGGGDVHAASATSLTVAGQILGTPYYMSPEQWGEMPRDGNPEVDGRTDVYSLGVIFFELIAGRKPLGGRTLSELRHKHVTAALPSLTEISESVPEGFSRAVANAMAKDRADRPQTAGEFVDKLRASLGMQTRSRGRNIHATDTGTIHATDAGGARGTQQPVQMSSEAATANLAPGADLLVRGDAGTLLTSDFEQPAEVGSGRETSGRQPGGNANARRGGGTHASQASETRAVTPADFQSRQVGETRVASQQEAAGQGAGVSITAPEPRRSVVPMVAGGALVLVLVAGVGGFFAWRGMQPKPDTPPNPPASTANVTAPVEPAAAPKTEAASYWFEAFDKPDDEAGKRIAETAATLVSGQRFRFHFVPKERGYLYIIAPGDKGNAQMTLLTAQGAGALKSNLVGAGADFAFPFGGARLKLDDNVGADEFTFIFSPTPLMSPSFLTGKPFKDLTPAEIKELEDFRAQFKSTAPSVAVSGDGDARRVTVSAPQTATSDGKPLIFDVRIDHK
jgi:eukaryotic-like serine/threonine-protein kinase